MIIFRNKNHFNEHDYIYKCTSEYLISSRFVGIAMQYMPKQVISSFYSIYSPVFLEYGLSETTRQCLIVSYHTLNKEWKYPGCTLGIYYCFINFDSMCLAFQWKLRMQKQGGFHQITCHDFLINDFERFWDFYLVKFEINPRYFIDQVDVTAGFSPFHHS